ncbi:electron transport protein [Salibacterium salarium]|uniref:electron transport protein n=1 Tax=Salibacterium salarium TaxID=284579 RepID=UPI00352202B0
MRKRVQYGTIIFIVLAVTAFFLFFIPSFRIAYMPSFDKVANKDDIYRNGRIEQVYDTWGESVSEEEASSKSPAELSSKKGTVKIDQDLLDLGREVFYKETFGNEVFLTDIMGILDGPLSIWNIAKASFALKGKGTNNLQVELAQTITIDDKTFEKGEKIDTGLAVPKGGMMPIGMPLTVEKGRVKAGITCAACHARVDERNGKIVEGATNTNLNVGLLMALASNSAAYFTHTEKENIEKYVSSSSREIKTSDNKTAKLPDINTFEQEVDKTLISWPRGFFDATVDLTSNPTQVGDSFTFGDHPYSWSGMGMAGPFNGLTTLSNNVHAQGADALAQSHISKEMFEIDEEMYIGTILQNAANERFRYQPSSSKKPSSFFKDVDPNPQTPGVNELVKLPTFPRVTLAAPDGLIVSSPGYKVNEQNNAVSAYQNTLVPPKPERSVSDAVIKQGREVFQRAGCSSCHAGRFKTNNQIIPSKEIGTSPTRAKALASTEKIWDKASIYAPDTPVPVPNQPLRLQIPSNSFSKNDVKLGFAHNGSDGGYKVKGLAGVYWQAPYLHDGGVAVGPDEKKDIGIPGTLNKGINPDPYLSMKAMVDESLRQKVIDANQSSTKLKKLDIKGGGHSFWVDKRRGFTRAEQNALVEYVLQLDGEKD